MDVPDLPGLDTNLGLQRALGKTGLYAEMLRRFVQGQAPVLPELQRALAPLGELIALGSDSREACGDLSRPNVSMIFCAA